MPESVIDPKPPVDPTNSDGAGGEPKPKAGDPDEKRFTQADLDRHLAERLDRERRKAEKAADEVKKKAEDDALAKRQEFEQLATTRGARLAELEPMLEKLTTDADAAQGRIKDLEEAIAADVKADLESLNLPASTKELLDGKSVLERRAWLTKHKTEFRRETPKGTPPTPSRDPEANAIAQNQDAQAKTGKFLQRIA